MPVHLGINHSIHSGKVNMSTFIYTIEEDGGSGLTKQASLWRDSAANKEAIADSRLDLSNAKEFDGHRFIPAFSGPILDEVADLCISYEYSSIILIDGEEDKWGFDDSTEAERSFFPPSYPDGPEITQAFMCAIEGWEY